MVVASTGAVAPAPSHVTDSLTCISALVPMPPVSHALAVELCATHCISWVIVNLRPLTVLVVTVVPGCTAVVNFDGSAAGPRTASIADDAS